VYAIDKAADDMQSELARQQAEEMAEAVGALESDATQAEEHAQPGEMAWLPVFYLSQLTQLDAAEEVIKKQAHRLLNEIDTRRKALRWRYGQPMQAQVELDLAKQRGKKRSVSYPTGTAGFRASGGREHVVVENEVMAIGHAESICPAAVVVHKHLLVTKVLEHTKATGEIIAGTKIETTPKVDNFYAGSMKFNKPELPAAGGAGDEQQTQRQVAEAFLASGKPVTVTDTEDLGL
jgi:hypothetical protein